MVFEADREEEGKGEEMIKGKVSEEEEREFYRKLTQTSFSRIWDNPKEDEVEKWYEEQYKKGLFYDQLNKQRLKKKKP